MTKRIRQIASLAVLAAAAVPGIAAAQTDAAPAASGIRLEVSATGEVARAPDIVTISTGVTTRADQASQAMRDNAAQMASVRAALQRAGIQARDIQTGSISLGQEFRPGEGGQMQPAGFTASNQLSVRYRDIAQSGRIIDALVAAGANNIQGPSFDIANRDAALDEARTRAVTAARARADLYARTLGTRVRRIVAVSEGGGPIVRPQMAYMARAEAAADTVIEPGQQTVSISISVVFELDQPAG